MWPRAFLDDPGGADDGDEMNYGDTGKRRKGQAGIQVAFFEKSRDGAKLRMEYRKRMAPDYQPPISKDPKAPIVVLEEPGALLNRAVDAYREALRLYTEEVDLDAQNPSFVCGAQQNLGVALMEANCCLEARTYLLQAEDTSNTNGLSTSQNHCALCENLCGVYAKLKDWKAAEEYARKAVEFDPNQGSLQLEGVGVSKLLTRQARHAFMLMMAGLWEEANVTSSIVFDQSRGHNCIKRRARMMLVRSVSTIELAMQVRDATMLDQGEGELIQCIATTKRAHGKHSMEAADVTELVAMFMGGVRYDYDSAERYALQAVRSREHGLLEQLEEERNPTVKGGEKKIVQIKPLPYDQDPRLQTLMEDSVSLLKNVQQKKFLTPWRFLVWKGT